MLAFRRGDVVCIVNLSAEPIALPVSGSVLVASETPARGLLAPDAAAWLHAPEDSPTPDQLTAQHKEHQR